MSPRWSPDGTKLAFTTATGQLGDRLWTMDADGSDVTS